MTTTETSLTAFAHWFPLVPRPRPVALPVADRIAALQAAAERAGQDHGDLAAATAVLNKAALLLSDTGHPDHARDLCWRQFDIVREHAPLPGTLATWALQPVVNIARLHIRARQGEQAHTILRTLHHAATHPGAVVIDGVPIDLGQLATPNAAPEVARFTWTTLLADGTRALTSAGRWADATAYAAQHHGIGERLFDGRQAAILAQLDAGDPDRALVLLDETCNEEPWEHAVAACLRSTCLARAGRSASLSLDDVVGLITALDPVPALVVFRVRVTLLLLQHTNARPGQLTGVVDSLVSHADGYTARDLLAADGVLVMLADANRRTLSAVLDASVTQAAVALDGVEQIMDAANSAEQALRRSLARMALS
jgi:hypothetical protein